MTSTTANPTQTPSTISMAVKPSIVGSVAHKPDERSAMPIQGLSKRAQAMAGPRVWGRINVQGRK